jgi:hypothetical protein
MLFDFIAGLFPGLISVLFPGTTRARGSLDEMRNRYPRSAVRRAELMQGWADSPDGELVAFVVANRRWLSFRDAYGHEELHWAADQVRALEPVLAPGFAGQQIRVIGREGEALIEFWCPDSDDDALTELTAALRR